MYNRITFYANGDIKQIAESGQAFRINPYKLYNNGYSVVSGNRLCFVKQTNYNIMSIYCNSKQDKKYFEQYFDINTDYSSFNNSILKCDDNFVKNAYMEYYGLRVLRQDIFECLISFIISQRMTIPRIKKCVELICSKYGHKLDFGFMSFPTPVELSKVNVNELESFGLGYRSQYIIECAKLFAKESIDEYFRIDRYNKLLSLKGVGPKIASCVDLYAFHNLHSYPVDTHIETMINEVYLGWFDETQFEPFEGYVQLLQFAYWRNLNKKDTKSYNSRKNKLF